MVDLPNIRGTLSRLSATLSIKKLIGDVITLGIDSLVSIRVLESFLCWLEHKSNSPALLVSPEIEIAPTHPRVRIEDGVISRYSPQAKWVGESYCDVGIRYFPTSTLQEMFGYIDKHGRNGCFIPEFLRYYAGAGKTLRCHTFYEDWKHFAYPHDLLD